MNNDEIGHRKVDQAGAEISGRSLTTQWFWDDDFTKMAFKMQFENKL